MFKYSNKVYNTCLEGQDTWHQCTLEKYNHLLPLNANNIYIYTCNIISDFQHSFLQSFTYIYFVLIFTYGLLWIFDTYMSMFYPLYVKVTIYSLFVVTFIQTKFLSILLLHLHLSHAVTCLYVCKRSPFLVLIIYNFIWIKPLWPKLLKVTS